MVQQIPLQEFLHHPNRLIMLIDENINGAAEYQSHSHEWFCYMDSP